MFLYREDDIGEGNARTVTMGGKAVDLYEKNFENAELIAASQAGWCSFDTIRAMKMGAQFKPKGPNGLV